MRVAAALLSVAALGGSPVPSVAAPRCVPDLAGLLAPALFARYPARRPAPVRWHAPDVRHGQAATYRTVLRREATGPADLAGRWQVVPIGCGAESVCPAFVDGATGRVRFVPALRGVAAVQGEVEGGGFETLTHHADSRLLVVIGSPNEDEARRGVSYYDWRDGRPVRVGFLPIADFCAGRRAM